MQLSWWLVETTAIGTYGWAQLATTAEKTHGTRMEEHFYRLRFSILMNNSLWSTSDDDRATICYNFNVIYSQSKSTSSVFVSTALAS